MNKLKILNFNIQKATSPSKLIHILNYAKNKKIQIMCLTEFDLNQSTELSSIQQLLSNFDFKIAIQSVQHRTAIIYHSSIEIISNNIFPRHNRENQLANFYVCDITINFKQENLTIISVYVPVYNNVNDNRFHCINKKDFIDTLCPTLSSLSRGENNLIICGDWNTHPMEATNLNRIESFLHQQLMENNLYDIFFLPNNRRSICYTNHGSNGTNNRLDRFHVSFNLLRNINFKYRVHQKLPFTTHRPVVCTLSDINSNSNNNIINKDNFYKRIPSIPDYIIENKQLYKYIFTNEILDTKNPSMDYNAYMQRVRWKTNKVIQIMKHLPSYKEKISSKELGFDFNDPQFNNISANLSKNFKRLRLRFGKHSNEANLDENIINDANSFYSNLFASNEIYSNQNLNNKFDKFTENIKEQLTEKEKNDLIKPFSKQEIYKNLLRLNENGPSSPGTDGITYRDWKNNWVFAAVILTNMANYILQGNHNR